MLHLRWPLRESESAMADRIKAAAAISKQRPMQANEQRDDVGWPKRSCDCVQSAVFEWIMSYNGLSRFLQKLSKKRCQL